MVQKGEAKGRVGILYHATMQCGNSMKCQGAIACDEISTLLCGINVPTETNTVFFLQLQDKNVKS